MGKSGTTGAQRVAALFREHEDAVRGVVAKNVPDPDDLDDCVQEVFTRALRKLPTLRDPRRSRSWLLSIAEHVAIDCRRRFRREAQRTVDEEADDIPTSWLSPQTELEVAELERTMRSSLADLGSRDEAALTMTTYLDFGPTEVAEALDVSHTNAKVILHRARRRLRNELVLRLRRRQGLGCNELKEIDPRCQPEAAEDHVAECAECRRRTEQALRPAS